MEIILKARKLTKFYQMGEVKVEALKGVEFDIYAGEFVVVLGPSGSGKSTMLNIIGGMDKASSGEIYFKGKPLHDVSEKVLTEYRRNAVGFVFQFILPYKWPRIIPGTRPQRYCWEISSLRLTGFLWGA